MGDFAVDVGRSYHLGAARGNLSILSAMDVAAAVFFANFGQTINRLILAQRGALEQKRKLDTTSARKHAAVGPKTRWVDGTPEYSFHICGLRKLFPDALFVHLVRDADAVVRSMLNFHRISGIHLVANEAEAYNYWLRAVQACLKAEQAYGPRVVHRLLYSTLMKNPEQAIQSLLGFVDESYTAICLAPLGERINSSNVPPDFKSEDPATDPAIVEEARRLWAEIEQTNQPMETSAAAVEELEMAFQELCSRRETIEQELARQEQHHAAAMAKQEQNYKNHLDKQRGEMRHLAAMLDTVVTIAESLRCSRFWRFANRAVAIEAKLFSSKDDVPGRRLQKISRNYSRWRARHPDIANLDEPIQRAEPPTSRNDSDG